MFKISLGVLFFICLLSGFHCQLGPLKFETGIVYSQEKFTYPEDKNSLEMFNSGYRLYKTMSQYWDCDLINKIAKEMVKEYRFSKKSKRYRKTVYMTTFPFFSVAKERGCI